MNLNTPNDVTCVINGANGTKTDFGCIPDDPSAFVGLLYRVGLGIIASVSILFIIYGGYLLIFSQGSQSQVAKGKRFITYAILGLLLSVFGYVFIQVIAIDILHLPGFN